MPTILWFFIAFVLASLIIAIISNIVINYRLKNDIKNLWYRQKPLECFIRPYHRYHYQYDTFKHQHQTDKLIDDKTWSDLNMDQLFQNINFNFTSIGEMRLYATLRQMYQVKNESLIKRFKSNVSFRESVSIHLAKLGKSIYPLFPNQLAYIQRNNFYMACTYLPFIFLILSIFNAKYGLLLTIASLLFNMVLSGTIRKTFDQDLNSIFYTSNVIKRAYDIHKIDGTPETAVNFKHFVVARKFSGLLGRANSNDDTFMLIMLIKLIFMFDYHVFHLIQNSFKKYESEVMACYDYVAEVDNHYAVALWRETLDEYCLPQAVNHQEVTFEGLTHPLIPNAVPNTLNVDNHILLTGSNASGKSTFMKAIALNLITAQTIQTATATKFKYQPGYVYTSMINQDDILSGDSYFMTEIKSIKRLFDLTLTDHIYCFIDEIFKGTNTTERIAASEAVLHYFDQQHGYTVIAATHDIELSELLDHQYSNYHFNESISGNTIDFDYKIKSGKADTRNAIELLRITDFPNSIYERAKSTTQ
ncbi:MutS-related protein [Staphylococcus gallinarum]|uniref:MutS-related protein n=1 Tax=Staphylococcus gallinarum TaxID=1293 RepID=UPI000D1EB723|nr:MutS family DNA mismatch repair protein [Staphylococcus gallinarum]MBU7217516.1 MutS family DNA mismatch repair protein [Staphylococcus gallinarum]MCD8794200.1 MutS family DNA mismatch repair protein [Staphylococcus gallinarum]PTK90997.1 DNA mismatch repair protein MutS [Staphylococcus gallinarum]RIL21522.1 MutS family DNA mismatch repair protein [Staphylococcus gallinarum]RIL23896.1 MutS family DNA mismatch repair protein [Staphylococcus gallinarum]